MAQFAMIDANGDGAIDRAEAIAAVQRQGAGADMSKADQMFEMFDTDKDDKITKEEYEQGIAKVFDEMMAPMMRAMGGGMARPE